MINSVKRITKNGKTGRIGVKTIELTIEIDWKGWNKKSIIKANDIKIENNCVVINSILVGDGSITIIPLSQIKKIKYCKEEKRIVWDFKI